MKKLTYLNFCLFLTLFGISCAPKQTPTQEKQLGIATYSVKGIETDIEGSFQALADDGYVVMEISNYNSSDGTVAGYKPDEYAALAEKYGLDIISSHTSAKIDVSDEAGTLAGWGKIFDDHKAMGCKYVVCPMNIFAGTPEAVKAECDLLNKIGEEANKRGILFGYHNHSIEFATIPGTDQFYEDFLITNTDPDKVFFEMDVYWTTIGGQDPVAYLQKYPDRIKVLHIKDDYVIGESGKIDFRAIFDQFYQNGYTDWFVEMEAKMTPEEKAQSLAMVEQLKDMQAKGGTSAGFSLASLMGMAASQMAVQKDSAAMARQLATSLEGISQSASYLKGSNFVK